MKFSTLSICGDGVPLRRRAAKRNANYGKNMGKLKLKQVVLLCYLFAPSIAAAQANSDIAKLINDCQSNGKNTVAMSEYTYLWKITQQGKDSKGKFRDEFAIYETYIPTLRNNGTIKWVLIQTHEKSQPLPADKVEKERQKASEKLLKIDTENQRTNLKDADPAENEQRRRLPGIYFQANVNFGLLKNVNLSIASILKGCVFENPREELLNERAAIKLEFRPSPSTVFEKDEKFLAQSQGFIWIDKTDRIVIKVEGRPLNSTPDEANVMFLYQSVRVPDGNWLPRLVRFNGTKNKAFFNGMGGDMMFEWLDYKRFVTDAEDAKIKPPQ